MTQIAEQLLNQALQLSSAEREVLAEQLYLSLDIASATQEEVDAAWGDEIAQRIKDVDSGRATLVEPEELHHDIRNLLNRG